MHVQLNIFQQLVGNIYWKDLNGRYLGCNQALATMLGVASPDEVAGKTDADFIKNQTMLKNLRKTDTFVIETGKETTVEEAGFDDTGKVVIYLTKKAPLKDDQGNIIGIVGTSINMAEYIDIKEYVIRHTAGNLYWKDKEGRYLGCNDSTAETLGLSVPSEIIGKKDSDLLGERLDAEHLKRVLQVDHKVIEEGVEVTMEEDGFDKFGRYAVYMTKKIPLRDNTNAIIGLVGTSLDITKQKQAEIAKLEFLRNMSHDIMTPFTGILGISRLMYDDETDSDKKLNLKYLIQSGERLLFLLKQILEVAELGNRKIQLEDLHIKEIIYGVVEMVSASAQFKGLALTAYCPDAVIYSDKICITRILLNFLSNAIKFTDSGSVHIEVKVAPLVISVTDTGAGIPSDKLEVIFEKFMKLSGSGQNKNFVGSGIGLYIAKQLAMELGGDIRVESELGKGSTFIFYARE